MCVLNLFLKNVNYNNCKHFAVVRRAKIDEGIIRISSNDDGYWCDNITCQIIVFSSRYHRRHTELRSQRLRKTIYSYFFLSRKTSMLFPRTFELKTKSSCVSFYGRVETEVEQEFVEENIIAHREQHRTREREK